MSNGRFTAFFRSLNLETMGDFVWAVFGDEPLQKHEIGKGQKI